MVNPPPPRGRKKKLKNIITQPIKKKRRKKDKSRNLFIFALVLLSASVERVGVSHMRDFLSIGLEKSPI